MNINIQTIPCGSYQANAYLVQMEGREDCALIDPGDDLRGLQLAIAGTGRKLGAILLTHGHFDHMLAAGPLARETGAQIYIHADDMEMLNDSKLNSYAQEVAVLPAPTDLQVEMLGDVLDICGMPFEVLSTPGHSKGSVCFYLSQAGVLFSGDTLFQAGFGRMDLYGGSPAQMRGSLKRLYALPGEVEVYPGHGPKTTIAAERARYHL